MPDPLRPACFFFCLFFLFLFWFFLSVSALFPLPFSLLFSFLPFSSSFLCFLSGFLFFSSPLFLFSPVFFLFPLLFSLVLLFEDLFLCYQLAVASAKWALLFCFFVLFFGFPWVGAFWPLRGTGSD